MMVGWSTCGVWLTAIGALLVAKPAASCSRICGDIPVHLPRKQAEIPGNLIRFRVVAPHPGRLALRTGGGRIVPASVQQVGLDRVFAPDTTVAAGTELTLLYEVRCGTNRNEGRFDFKVGPPAQVELRRAELTVHEQGTRAPGSAYNETGFVRLRYDGPESSGNAGHLLVSTVTVDGRAYQFDERLSADGVPMIEVASDCMLRESPSDAGYQIDSCGHLRSVPPGKHTVLVKPHLIGGEVELAPVSLEVTTVCPRGLVPTPDASNVKPVPPSPAPARVRPAGDARAVTSAAPPTRKSSGCAVGAREGGSTAGALLLGVVAAGALLRKRQRAGSSSARTAPGSSSSDGAAASSGSSGAADSVWR